MIAIAEAMTGILREHEKSPSEAPDRWNQLSLRGSIKTGEATVVLVEFPEVHVAHGPAEVALGQQLAKSAISSGQVSKVSVLLRSSSGSLKPICLTTVADGCEHAAEGVYVNERLANGLMLRISPSAFFQVLKPTDMSLRGSLLHFLCHTFECCGDNLIRFQLRVLKFFLRQLSMPPLGHCQVNAVSGNFLSFFWTYAAEEEPLVCVLPRLHWIRAKTLRSLV